MTIGDGKAEELARILDRVAHDLNHDPDMNALGWPAAVEEAAEYIRALHAHCVEIGGLL